MVEFEPPSLNPTKLAKIDDHSLKLNIISLQAKFPIPTVNVGYKWHKGEATYHYIGDVATVVPDEIRKSRTVIGTRTTTTMAQTQVARGETRFSYTPGIANRDRRFRLAISAVDGNDNSVKLAIPITEISRIKVNPSSDGIGGIVEIHFSLYKARGLACRVQYTSRARHPFGIDLCEAHPLIEAIARWRNVEIHTPNMKGARGWVQILEKENQKLTDHLVNLTGYEWKRFSLEGRDEGWEELTAIPREIRARRKWLE